MGQLENRMAAHTETNTSPVPRCEAQSAFTITPAMPTPLKVDRINGNRVRISELIP